MSGVFRIMRVLLFPIAAICCFAAAAFGQTYPGSAKGDATVYLYRIDYDPFLYSFIFSRRMSVKFAEAANAPKELPQIASLRKNRYLILKLKPGSYVFDTRQMDGKLRVDLAAGDVRFLRLDQGYDCPSEPDLNSYANVNDPFACENRSAGIFEMPAGKGNAEIKKMKPIGKGDVKARALVIIPPK